jgi:hypothetical protein
MNIFVNGSLSYHELKNRKPYMKDAKNYKIKGNIPNYSGYRIQAK